MPTRLQTEIKPRAGFSACSVRQSSDGGAAFWQEKGGALGKESTGTVITWKLGFRQRLALLSGQLEKYI